MAKKNSGFDFGGYFDQDALSMLIDKKDANAPTESEIELIEKTEGDIILLPLSALHSYHNHTYKVLDNEDMDALVDSIKDIGIILPLLVRKTKVDEYEIISGHRRRHAAELAGLETVPCKIVEADDATADMMMVDTNLHREEILPSEKAKSYKVKIEAMKKKGLIPDSAEGLRKYEEQLAKDIKTSRASIFRYRKLLDLLPTFLDLIDEKEISVNAGAKLANIPKEQQECVLKAMEIAKKPITIEMADKLATAAASKEGLTTEKAVEILTGGLKPRKRTLKKAEVKEKDFAPSLPKAINELEAKEKAEFLKVCIEEYIKTHDEWNGAALK